MWLKRAAIGTAALLTVLCVIGTITIYRLNSRVANAMENRDLAQPTRFFAGLGPIEQGQHRRSEDIVDYLNRLKYRKRSAHLPVRPGDYKIQNLPCIGMASEQKPSEDEKPEDIEETETENENSSMESELASEDFTTASSFQCLKLQKRATSFSSTESVTIEWKNKVISSIWLSNQTVKVVYLEPLEFAQFLGDQPILRDRLVLGETPTQCLNAVLAIEDPHFLKHSGVSLSGLVRSLYVNLVKGGFKQGGSTITMQVVRNSWLTLRKTIKRKLTELAMAPLLEFHAPKDLILEMYLNIIYMGQSGPFQVRGFKAASQHYFNKDIGQLGLADCALLAAVLNSPGLYNPFTRPENATKRRDRVLKKMREQGYISDEEYQSANASPLPKKQQDNLIQPTLWFVDSAKRQLKDMQIDLPGKKILTTMDISAQIAAYEAVKKELPDLDKKAIRLSPNLAEKKLEAAVLSASVESGEILALIGGRNFRTAPFNRAVSAHRQVGSVMKPLVYLAALESLDSDGQNFTPLHPIEDTKFTHRFEGQSWSPQNYTEEEHGKVPLYWAMKNSLNIATAKLGLQIGLDSLVDVSRRLGVTSEIKALPALTLGAFELYPKEVLRIYLTLARFGSLIEPHMIKKVQDEYDETIYEFAPAPVQVLEKNTVAVLVSMMKQTILGGTGISISTWRNFRQPAAGKTGTTSDNRDAWFSGFTPKLATVAWVGYDNNMSHKLTGASGAIPIWTNYMKAIATRDPGNDFSWPDGVRREEVKVKDLEEEPVSLWFRKFSRLKDWE